MNTVTVGNKGRKLVHADESKCAGCITCMLRCSFKHGHEFNLSNARIQIRRLVDQPNEFRIDFTEECNSCGICVRHCPYGALSWQEAGEK